MRRTTNRQQRLVFSAKHLLMVSLCLVVVIHLNWLSEIMVEVQKTDPSETETKMNEPSKLETASNSKETATLSSSDVISKVNGTKSSNLGAVVLLASARNAVTWWNDITRFCFLMRAVRSVDQHLNRHYGPYPIHIMIATDYDKNPINHDGPYSENDRALIRSWAPNSDIFFEEINLYSKDALEPDATFEQIMEWRQGHDGAVEGRDIGYTSMCRLWSGRLQMMDFLKRYKFYMRLDDDSMFTDRLAFDPFEEMNNKGLQYVWKRDAHDHWGVSKLFEIIDRHVELKFGLPFVKGNGKNFDVQGLQPYNNFHMASVDFWSKPKWKAFWDDLNKEHLFFKYRVGDANVHAAVAMMLATNEYERWMDIPYVHNSNDMRVGWGQLAWKEECESAEKDFHLGLVRDEMNSSS